MTDKEFTLLHELGKDTNDKISKLQNDFNNFLINRYDTCPVKKSIDKKDEIKIKKAHLILAIIGTAISLPGVSLITSLIFKALKLL